MFDLGLPIWLMIFWLVAVGGAVGSFLNVVVYRLPLGISLIHPPSHCPKCGKQIPWYDNVPVFGWLALWGRCRQCHNPISARYPIIEAITAAMFGVVAIAEMPYMCKTEFFGLYPYHILLLCTLLSAGLIEYDGNRVPWTLFLPALIAGIVAPLVWPELQALPMLESLPTWLDGLAGLTVGAVFGGIAWATLPDPKPIGLIFGLLCVGLFCGGLAVATIAIVTAVIECAQWIPRRVSPRLRIPASVTLGVFTLVWILFCARLVFS